jgi:urease accessory protein
MTDQHGKRRRRLGGEIEMKRLKPKIMSGGGSGDDERQKDSQETQHEVYLAAGAATTGTLVAGSYHDLLRLAPTVGLSTRIRPPIKPWRKVPKIDGASISSVMPLALVLAALAAASPAQAHLGTGLPGGFVSGFVHPLTGFDHMLAMVSVGVWGAFLGRPLIVALPVIFPTVMAFGAFLGMAGVPFPPVEIGIALSVLLLGISIAGAWRAPVWAACVIVAVFGLFHGYAHGRELPSAADPIGFSVGFVLATGLLHVAGIGIGFLNEKPWGLAVTRSLGAFVAIAGLYFLAAAVLK